MIEAILMGLALAWVTKGICDWINEKIDLRDEAREEAKEEAWRIYQASKGKMLQCKS